MRGAKDLSKDMQLEQAKLLLRRLKEKAKDLSTE